jgi:hypothetical protein
VYQLTDEGKVVLVLNELSTTPWRRGGTAPSRHYMGVSGQLHAPVPLPPRKEPPVPTQCEAGSAPQSVWTLRRREKSLALPRNRTPTVQPVARYYMTEIYRLRTVVPWWTYYSTNVTGSPSYVQRVLLNLFKSFLHIHNASSKSYLKASVHCTTCFDRHWSPFDLKDALYVCKKLLNTFYKDVLHVRRWTSWICWISDVQQDATI